MRIDDLGPARIMDAKGRLIPYGRVRIVVALLLAGAAFLYLSLSSCGTEKGTPPGPSAAAVNVLTYHNDVARTGQNLNETLLMPANVNSSGFGRVGFMQTSATGMVDAQPLFVANLNGTGRNVLFTATEDDIAYAF